MLNNISSLSLVSILIFSSFFLIFLYLKKSKMPSTQISDAELTKVFFYGTLKKNQPNEEHLFNRNVTYVSEGVTVDKYPLIIGSDFNIPFLLNRKGFGKVMLKFIRFKIK